jgi:hypothetical protein
LGLVTDRQHERDDRRRYRRKPTALREKVPPVGLWLFAIMRVIGHFAPPFLLNARHKTWEKLGSQYPRFL